MHHRHCTKLSERMHELLLRELGQGIDRSRLLLDVLYARDVLLVCEALVGTEGPLFARAFRRAMAAPSEDELARRASSLRRHRARPWPQALQSLIRGLVRGVAHAFTSRSSSAPSAT